MSRKVEVKLNQDGRRWDVTRGGKVVKTCETIKQAIDTRYDLTHKVK